MTSSPASLDLLCEPLRQDTSEVERVLLKSVALDPDLRFPSASQFVDALDEASAARDAVAKVGSTVSSSGRRAVAVAGAAVVVVLVLVATGLPLLRSVTPTSHTPTLLLQDTFASASGGALPADGYIEGEYAIVKPTPEADGWRDIRVPVNAADTDLSVIARLVSEDPRGQIILARAQNIGTPDYAAYQFVVLPRLRAFGLKLHRGLTDTYLGGMLGISFTNMLPEQPSENGVELLELKCSGDSVVARINNVVVAPAQDTQLHQGIGEIQAAGPAGAAAEARLRNLIVRAAPPEASRPVPQAGGGYIRNDVHSRRWSTPTHQERSGPSRKSRLFHP